MAEAIFEPAGDGVYRATEAALSPWSDQMLHGGPPAMLMAREIERFPTDRPMFVTRLTVELLRPVGTALLAVRSRLLRPGRKVQLVEASLWSGDVEVARATAVRIRAMDMVVPVDGTPLPHEPPESLIAPLTDWRTGPAYHKIGVEVRVPSDPSGDLGPGWAWFRLRLPVVPGEEPSGLQRICAVADFPNGISRIVDPNVMTFVNPDMTLYVHRLPVDEWVMLDAKTWLEPHGTGMAEGAIYDRRGRLGRSVQSLLVEPRG
ncbi:MAG TPA: thioesterase family protein [Patescibacteria group bacterium]|nr:thioesterase family protein [Patescibacteria group bacterium]